MEFWELTVRFFSLADANVQNVVAGSVLLGCAAGLLSTYVYLQKRSLLGDALAHAALPGVGIAFLLVGRKDLPILLAGAALTAWLGALAISQIVRKTKIKLDSALGIVLTVFFGLGIVILTHIQKSGSGAQSGLDKFLFGQAAAITSNDVTLLFWITLALLIIVVAGFSRLKILSFDAGFARTLGIKVGWLQFLLTTMIVVAVTAGLQAVGVVLMAAMLITPAAAARQWTDRLGMMTFLASLFGMIAGLLGAYVSFLAPKFPTGPWIVVVISAIFGLSLLFSPKRGVISRWRNYAGQRKTMAMEHVLKVLYKAGAKIKSWNRAYSPEQIAQMWSFSGRELRWALNRLKRRGLLLEDNGLYRFSADGIGEGARVIRRHRLWEVYLTRFLELPIDHVHRDAEQMEHILTPDMEKRLEELLGRPEFDPHQQEIPYVEKEAGR
jgi:manganese/zinc/iron transport system permease protein